MSNILVFLFINFNLCILYAQVDISNSNENISFKLYTKSFKNLNHGFELSEKYPVLKKDAFCSILGSITLLAYNEIDFQNIGKARLKGIATQLFQEGNPVYLINGMNSFSNALKENENINDDNKIVYISVGECIIPNYVSIAMKIFNQKTKELLENNKKNF
jgi:hypothetical protein